MSIVIGKCFLDLSPFVYKYICEPFLGTHLRVKVKIINDSLKKKRKNQWFNTNF